MHWPYSTARELLIEAVIPQHGAFAAKLVYSESNIDRVENKENQANKQASI